MTAFPGSTALYNVRLLILSSDTYYTVVGVPY